MTQKLGRLERVDLRETWPTEGGDFTPWLADEENLKILGDTIGLELELEAKEKNVGPFRADILCKDTGNGSLVLVENQLEKTDHLHLGQLMTYAAGLDAVTIIWVAPNFTEQHRSALDWLNKITDTDFHFFGLEIELWKIENSKPAPKFNIISKPNDWSSTVSRTARTIGEVGLNSLQEFQLNYWNNLADYFREQDPDTKLRSPRPQHWYDFSIGRTNVVRRISINSKDNKIVAGVYFDSDMKEKYSLVFERKDEIESQFGETLEWVESTESIKIEKPADIKNEDDWPEQHKWFKEKLDAFDRVFRPIIKDL